MNGKRRNRVGQRTTALAVNTLGRDVVRASPIYTTAPVQAGQISGSMPRWNRREFTTALVEAGDTSKMEVEFCRVNDAQRLWGLKRGLVYRKIKSGTIRSLTLRERGKKFGVRLLLVESIRTWLMSELEAQERESK
jgi:hypothetical protein